MHEVGRRALAWNAQVSHIHHQRISKKTSRKRVKKKEVKHAAATDAWRTRFMLGSLLISAPGSFILLLLFLWNSCLNVFFIIRSFGAKLLTGHGWLFPPMANILRSDLHLNAHGSFFSTRFFKGEAGQKRMNPQGLLGGTQTGRSSANPLLRSPAH
jgi:hypothetical protein